MFSKRHIEKTVHVSTTHNGSKLAKPNVHQNSNGQEQLFKKILYSNENEQNTAIWNNMD